MPGLFYYSGGIQKTPQTGCRGWGSFKRKDTVCAIFLAYERINTCSLFFTLGGWFGEEKEKQVKNRKPFTRHNMLHILQAWTSNYSGYSQAQHSFGLILTIFHSHTVAASGKMLQLHWLSLFQWLRNFIFLNNFLHLTWTTTQKF